MTREENIKLATTYFDGFNAHDLSKYKANLADGYSAEFPGAMGRLNREQAVAYSQAFINAFPDGRFQVTRVIADGDFVAVHWTASGTHTAALASPSGQKIPATNKKARLSGCSISEVKNGKVTREWSYWDQVALLTQLGLMPEAQAAAAIR